MRDIRRHHVVRMKAKAKRLAMNIWGLDENAMKKHYNQLKPCSCFMCGNPRRCFGEKTRQEILNHAKQRRSGDDSS